MTGLYENIYDLQNDRSLAFLYCAPKLILEPLNYSSVRNHYQKFFDIDTKTAGKMTGLTKGYPFAFQVPGYLYWEKRDQMDLEDILPEYDQYLEECVYSKIWSELSSLDQKILMNISPDEELKVKDLRERLQMSSELFPVYRERLKRKGVIDTGEYGKIAFALPRFAHFVEMQKI